MTAGKVLSSMEDNLLHVEFFGNNNQSIKRNRIIQLIIISLFTLSLILSIKLLMQICFPRISLQYNEMTIIIASCLAVNLAASLILVKYQAILQNLENRLEVKVDNINSIIKDLKIEREERRRNATDLRRIEGKYRYLVSHVSEGIMLMNGEGNFLEANQKMGELLGFSEAELLTMNLRQIVPLEEHERIKAALEEAVRMGESNLAGGRLIRKDEIQVPVHFAGFKVDQGGKTIIQGIFRVLTEHRQAV